MMIPVDRQGRDCGTYSVDRDGIGGVNGSVCGAVIDSIYAASTRTRPVSATSRAESIGSTGVFARKG
jgi:hypothetical protein